ncbi:MAG: ABC transporter permease [Clostridia bacterium]|nr:ABC transporter permease [Clostridia bacterium]
MKRDKLIWFFVFIGILLIFISVFLLQGTVEKVIEINGEFALSKVVVSVKNQIASQGNTSFSEKEMSDISKHLKTEDITYEAISGLRQNLVSNNELSLPSRVTGVRSNYTKFFNLDVIYGSSISSNQEKEGAYVAVISKELAWNLFKSVNPLGKKITIWNHPFIVIGIIEDDDSIIGKLTDDGLYDVYVPVSKMLELDTTSRITTFQVKTDNKIMIGDFADIVTEAMQQTGKNANNYTITDMNLERKRIEQKPKLIVFFMGLVSIGLLLKCFFNEMRDLVITIFEASKSDYLSNVLKEGKKDILIISSKFLVICFAIGILIKLAWFSIYIPSEYVPDSLINIAYYQDLFKSIVKSTILSIGYIAPRDQLIHNTAETLTRQLFLLPAAFGFLLFLAGMKMSSLIEISRFKMTIYSGLFCLISMGLILGMNTLLGLPSFSNLSYLVVVWSFIYITIYKGNLFVFEEGT